MKLSGDIPIQAPRDVVFARLRDARFFASCVDGVTDLKEIGPDRYTATLQAKVAFMSFRFAVTVELIRAEPPDFIEAKVEGAPLGIAGRLSARTGTTLFEDGPNTIIAYDVEATLTGKLGSIGQPVLRAKAKEMEASFAAKLHAAFAADAEAAP